MHVHVRAPLLLSVCCWLADTEACVDHAQHAASHGHRHPYDLNSIDEQSGELTEEEEMIDAGRKK